VYDEEAVNNMISSWKKQKEQYYTFLQNYEATIEDGIKKLHEQMELQKQKVITELQYIEEGLKLWENPQQGE
jgi:hypothetical protein